MRLNTVIKHLGIEEQLDKEDLEIINSLIKNRKSESKKHSNKILIDSVALIYYMIKNVDKEVVYLSPKDSDALEVMNKIVELLKGSKLPKKKMFIPKKKGNELFWLHNVRMVFKKASKRATLGYTMHWVLVNDIRYIDPEVYYGLYNNMMPVMDAMKDSKVTLSP